MNGVWTTYTMFIVVLAAALGPIALARDPGMDSRGSRFDSRYEAHDPIYIGSNIELQDMETAGEINGSGTPGDPYVIENLVIEGGSEQYCIRLVSVNHHLLIRNCHLSGASFSGQYYNGSGVILKWVMNLVISNCVITDNDKCGIFALESSDVMVDNCNLSGNERALYISESEDFLIRDSTISGNSMYGVILWHTDSSRVVGNLICWNRKLGVGIYYGSGNEIYFNTIVYNNGAREQYAPPGEYPYPVDFRQAYDDGSLDVNRWYHDNSRLGNHWRELLYPDDDGNGVIDIHYQITGGSAVDRYPAIHSFDQLIPTGPREIGGRVGRDWINITWEEPIDDGSLPISGYVILRGTDPDYLERICTVGPTVRFYNDTLPGDGTVFYYTVLAKNHEGTSIYPRIISGYGDTSPPELYLDNPDEGEIYNSSHVEVKWSCTDNLSGLMSIKISLDGEDPQSTGGSRHLLHGLDDGPHSVIVTALDTRENSISKTRNFTVDTTPPELLWAEPEPFSAITVNRFVLEFSFLDETTDVVFVEVIIDDGKWEEVAGDESVEVMLEGEGIHNVSLRALDRAGNWGGLDFHYIVDKTPPELSVLSPLNGSYVSSATVNLHWSGSDLCSGLSYYEVQVDDGPVTNCGEETSLKLEDVEDGAHHVALRAVDMAGLISIAEVNFTVDTVAPVVEDHFPIGDGIPPDSWIIVNFSEPMDPDEVVIGIHGLSGEVRWENGYTTLLFIPDEPLEYGRAYTFRVTGKDLASNPLVVFEWGFRTIEVSQVDMGSIYGLVVDGYEKGIPNATVRIDTFGFFSTDGSGHFDIPVSNGNHTVEIDAEGFIKKSLKLYVAPNQEYDMGVIALEPLEEEAAGGGDGHLPLWAAGGAVLVSLLVLLIILLILRRRRSTIEESPEERLSREKREIYTPVDMKRDRVRTREVSVDDEIAVLSMVPEGLEMGGIPDGDMLDDPLESYPVDIPLEDDLLGIDMSVLEGIEDKDEAFDWEDFANPLYEKDPNRITDLEEVNCYDVLGIDREASIGEVRIAYRMLAMRFHPDRVRRLGPMAQKAAIEEMKVINFAKDTLMDPGRRADHDERISYTDFEI